ncbi:hypothetical protein BH11MYX1_BH11MYX1_11890 [soil metagenome]
MRAVVVVGICLLGPAARAEECAFTDAGGATLVDRLQVLDPTALPAPASAAPRGFFTAGSGAVGALTELRTANQGASEATVGGHLLADGRLGWHRGFQLCGHADVVAGTESRSTTSFGFEFPWIFGAVSMQVDQEIQARPRLDAGRLWLRRPYAMNAVHVGTAVAMWRGDGPDPTVHSVFALRYTTTQQSQDRFKSVLSDVAFAMYEAIDTRTRLDVFLTELESFYPHGIDANGTGLVSTELVRFDPLDVSHVFRDHTITAAFGFVGASGASEAAPALCGGGCLPIVGSVHVAWPALGGTLGLGVERSAHVAMDDVITVEDRTSADYRRESPHHTLRASAFAALTRTSATLTAIPTGGASVGIDLPLPEKLALAIDLAGARSYYGRLDSALAPSPELAGSATVRLERRFNVNPPRQ